MAKYQKKPVVVEAFKFCVDEMPLWFMYGVYDQKYYVKDGETYIRTLEGDMHVSEGDYIIKGIQGEFYPCKPDIFNLTYEKVD